MYERLHLSYVHVSIYVYFEFLKFMKSNPQVLSNNRL